jgi:hypothetical protein
MFKYFYIVGMNCMEKEGRKRKQMKGWKGGTCPLPSLSNHNLIANILT